MPRKIITGYYVRAIRGAGVHAEWRPLLGPFLNRDAAYMMERVVERACRRHALYKGCTFGIWRTRDERDKLPKARLQLELVVDDEWCADVIEASRIKRYDR